MEKAGDITKEQINLITVVRRIISNTTKTELKHTAMVFEMTTTYFFGLMSVLATSDGHMATLTGEFDF